MASAMHNKNTVSVHAGKRMDSRGVVNAVEPSTAFRYIDEGEQPYPRYFNTPNQQVVVDQICALEYAEAGMIFGSGMASISTTMLALLKPGDHVVLQNELYGGTHSLVTNEFQDSSIEFTFANCDVDSLMAATRPNTRLIYVETPANPLLTIIDLKSLATAARSNGILTAVDNTFASPINQNPISLGFDIAIHSGTKYLSGHSDLSFGAVVSSKEVIQRIHKKAVHLGGSVNAMTCYLIERSLKTLAIRVERQSQNAQKLAEYLLEHPKVASVYYPGLESHPGHEIAVSQMSGFGGMISFALNRDLSAKKFLQDLKLIAPAMSLGGVESTVTIPALTSHKPMSVEERIKQGICDQLIRFSVGIEDSRDLIADLNNALLVQEPLANEPHAIASEIN